MRESHKGSDSDHYFILLAALYFSLFAGIVDDWILALERSYKTSSELFDDLGADANKTYMTVLTSHT